ncbi:MAG: YceI family protein [Acidimicrobiales bacterium]|nr:YceI family protein [Acidimicrobiales bacterium]
MRKKLLIGIPLLIILVFVAIWFFLFRGDAPPPPDAQSAAAIAEAAQTTTTIPSTTSGDSTTTTQVVTTTTEADTSIEGSWVVDTTIGSFEDFSSSYVGFRIEEELAQGIGKTTAVGRTPVVSGTLEFSSSALLSAEIIADLSQITTDRSWRDDNVYDALDAGNHPNAVFSLVGPLTLDDPETEGIEHPISAMGELTIKGITQEVSVELIAQRIGQIITVTGQFPMIFSDFGVEVPTAPIVVSVEDNGLIEVQLFLTPAS